MGCVFSRKHARIIGEKRKIPKTHDTHIPFYGAPIKKQQAVKRDRPTPSKGATLLNINENIHQEYSTLAFLMGGKNFPDPELVFGDEKRSTSKAIPDQEVLPQTKIIPITVPVCQSSHEAIPDDIKIPVSSTPNLLVPDCVTYEGLHQYGFHLFTVDSEKYSSSLESSECIPGAISCTIGGDMCVVVFKQEHGGTAYIPDQSAYARELFHNLSTRLGQQLMRIVYHKPSWYVQWCVEKQSQSDRQFFSVETMEKMRFTKDITELGKLTGFPGKIVSSN
ncbi:hypothetical protein OS493_025147 [Desmophyllum pertusum]|uniref:Uncharacterized protein n=1 Tax=Desmophyllum pertusum TaxID=174260 RepID=A0A9X0D7P1_9CNID|nr:hypothetical protein OS493_025147 [Desmophyllum pertusum]